MVEREFSLGTREFKLLKIDALKQFHIVRRIGPILSDLLPGMKDAGKLKEAEKLSEGEKLDVIAKFVGPIMTGLSKLSDADAELVLYGLLHAVEVKHAGQWSRISTGSLLMIQDFELPVMMQLAGRAFMYNLSGFFAALPQK